MVLICYSLTGKFIVMTNNGLKFMTKAEISALGYEREAYEAYDTLDIVEVITEK